MRKFFCLLLVLTISICLFACGSKPVQKNRIDTTATEQDITTLESLYAGLQAHHGQLHEHSDTGRRGDGHATLAEWKENMPAVGLEFVGLMDHRQTDHMYHEDWDSSLFISGTEARTNIKDRSVANNTFHYNMIFKDVSDMEALMMKHYSIFKLSGGIFRYGSMDSAEFVEVIQDILAADGFFVIAHPGQTRGEQYDDALVFYFCDGVGYEVFYDNSGSPSHREGYTKTNYAIYTALLDAGKKVYATAGSDCHSYPTDLALSTIYTANMQDDDYVQQLHDGNFTAGPVGVRMCVGDAVMGATTDFQSQRVVVSVGDFHESYANGQYQMKVFSDQGLVCTVDIPSTETCYFAFDAQENAKFYRVEIHDTTKDYTLLAMGNPIWND